MVVVIDVRVEVWIVLNREFFDNYVAAAKEWTGPQRQWVALHEMLGRPLAGREDDRQRLKLYYGIQDRILQEAGIK